MASALEAEAAVAKLAPAYKGVQHASALFMLEEELSCTRILNTGLGPLDEMLGGGLRTGQITELCGPAGSAKTQVCLSTTASLLLSSTTGRVVYMCSKSSFPAARLVSLLRDTLHCRIDAMAITQGLQQQAQGGQGQGQQQQQQADLCTALPSVAAAIMGQLAASHSHRRQPLSDPSLRAAVEQRLRADVKAAVDSEVAALLKRVTVLQVFEGYSLIAALRDVAVQLAGIPPPPPPAAEPAAADGDGEDDAAEVAAAAADGTAGGSGGASSADPLSSVSGLPAAAVPRMSLSVSTGSTDPLHVQLLVLDSIAGAVAHSLGGTKNYAGHALLCEAGKLLQWLAKRYHMAVLVTNHVVMDRDRASEDGGAAAAAAAPSRAAALRPALGPSWACIPDTTLMLGNPQQSSLADRSISVFNRAWVYKSCSLPLQPPAVAEQQRQAGAGLFFMPTVVEAAAL